MSVELHPWERQPGEHPRAFGAFGAYRDLPPAQRTMARVVEVTGVKAGMLRKWMAVHRWEARAAAWDREKDAITLEEQRRVHKEVAARHANLTRQFMVALALPLRELSDRVAQGRLSFEGLSDAKLLQLAARCGEVLPRMIELERLSHGMPTGHQVVTGADGKPLEVRTFVDVVRTIFQQSDNRVEVEAAAEEAIRGLGEARDVTPQAAEASNGNMERWTLLPAMNVVEGDPDPR